MQPSRRDFLKLTTVGGVAAAVFGFDLQPAYAQLRNLKIARASETRSHLPLLLRQLRRNYLHPRRSRKKCNPASSPCRRRPRSSYKSRHPLPQGRLPPTRYLQRPANHKAAGPPAGLRPLGRYFLGKCAQRNRAEGQEDPRRYFHRKGRQGKKQSIAASPSPGPAAAPTPTNSIPGRKDHARPGGRAPGKPGQSLTRPYGLKFGTNIRPGRNDQRLGRYQEHRHDAHHGRESGREPSLRLQVGHRSEDATATPK